MFKQQYFTILPGVLKIMGFFSNGEGYNIIYNKWMVSTGVLHFKMKVSDLIVNVVIKGQITLRHIMKYIRF